MCLHGLCIWLVHASEELTGKAPGSQSISQTLWVNLGLELDVQGAQLILCMVAMSMKHAATNEEYITIACTMSLPYYKAAHHEDHPCKCHDHLIGAGILSKDRAELLGVNSMALESTGICQGALLLDTCDLDGDVEVAVLEVDLPPGRQAADVELIALGDASSP